MILLPQHEISAIVDIQTQGITALANEENRIVFDACMGAYGSEYCLTNIFNHDDFRPLLDLILDQIPSPYPA